MAKITLVEPIEAAIEHQSIKQIPRPYLGYSQIGGECLRNLWLNFHWVSSSTISPRILRLFERGHHEELVILKDLRNIGAKVTNREAEVVGPAGHILGHIDGEVINVPGAEKTLHLLEMKTMKDSKFKEFKKVGLKLFSSTYWFQVHSYMDKRKLKRCLYIVTNKDTEERVYQRIHFDPSVAKEADHIGFHIITEEEPGPKIGPRTWFACKFCDNYDFCHKRAEPNRNCRTCRNVSIEDNGKWSCDLLFDEGENKPHFIPVETQRVGCDLYKVMPCLTSDLIKK